MAIRGRAATTTEPEATNRRHREHRGWRHLAVTAIFSLLTATIGVATAPPAAAAAGDDEIAAANGLAALIEDTLGGLADFDELGEPIPGTDLVPTGPAGLDLQDTLTGIADEIRGLGDKTESNVESALNGLTSVGPVDVNIAGADVDTESGTLTIDTFELSRAVNAPLAFSDGEPGSADFFSLAGGSLTGEISIDLTSDAPLVLDLVPAGGANEGSIVGLADPVPATVFSADLDLTTHFDARLGVLDVGVDPGDSGTAAATSIEITVDWLDPDGSGTITGDELVNAAPTDLFNADVTGGAVSLDVVLSADLDGLGGETGTVTLDDPDLTDGFDDDSLTFDLGELGNFTNFTPQDVLSSLAQLAIGLRGLQLKLGNLDLPLVDENLAELANWSDRISRLFTERGLAVAENPVDLDISNELLKDDPDTPEEDPLLTLEQIITELEAALEVPQGSLGLAYDPTDDVATFTISLDGDEFFHQTPEASVNVADELAHAGITGLDLTGGASLSADPSYSLDLTAGLDLSAEAAAPDEEGTFPPITDRVFLEIGDGDELSLDVPLEGDLAMVGTIGFLQIDLVDSEDGPVELLAPVDATEPMLAVDLAGTSGDRLTLTELFDATSSVEVTNPNPGQFQLDLGDGVTITATANVGVPELSLDATTSLEGVPDAEAGVTFAWPDLFAGDPQITTSTDFDDDFLSFNLDDEDPLALLTAILEGTEALFGTFDRLDQAETDAGDLLAEELPLASTSIDDAMSFVGDVRDALNAMASDPSASLQLLELQASAVIATALDELDLEDDVFDVPEVPDPNDFVSGTGDDEEFDQAAFSDAVADYRDDLQAFVDNQADFLDIEYEPGSSPGSVVLDFDIGVCSDAEASTDCHFSWPISKPFNLDLGDFGGGLVGAGTDGEISVDYGVNVSADFGIDLPTVEPGGDGIPDGGEEPDVELFVLDTTGITADIAGTTSGQAQASVGPFEVQVGDESGVGEDADAGECDDVGSDGKGVDDDDDGAVNDGCPPEGEPEDPDAGECDNAVDDEEDKVEDDDETDEDESEPADGLANDGCPAVNNPFDAGAGVSMSLTNDLGSPDEGDRSTDIPAFFDGLSPTVDPAADGCDGDVLACADLPIYLSADSGDDPTYLGTIEFEQDDFDSTPDLDGAEDVFQNLEDEAPQFLWSLLADGIEEFGTLVERSLDAREYGAELPMVGDLLDAGADVGGAFRSHVTDPASDLVTSLEDAGDFTTVESEIRDHFWNTLGPDGADLLLHHDDVLTDDGDATDPVKDEDIVVTLRCGDDGHDCDPASDDFRDLEDVEVEFKMGEVAAASSPEFDFGVPGLRLSGGGGTVSSSIDWQLNVGFGIGKSDGFYLLTDTDVDSADSGDGSADGDELTLGATVDLGEPADTGGADGALDDSLTPALEGDLAFLGVDVHNAKSDRADPGTDDDGDGRAAHEATIDLTVDIDDPDGSGGDGRLGLSELVTGFEPSDFEVGLDAGIDLYLTLATAANFGDEDAEAAIPSLLADLSLEWDLDGSLSDGLDYGTLDARFDNVRLDLGSFVAEFLAPVLSEVQRFTEPLQPIIDTLQAPIPGVADLAELVGAEPVTLLDLMEQLADSDLTLIRRLLDVVSLANSIPTDVDAGDDSLVIALGEFGLDGELLGQPELPANEKGELISTETVASAVDGDDGVFGSDEFSGFGGDFGSNFADATRDDGGFTFPAFENPGQLFQLLVGENPTLVRFDAGTLRAEVSHSVTFGPIALGPVPVSVVVSIGAAVEGRFAMGYDTQGIRRMVQNLTDDDAGNDGLFENVGVLFAGVFIDDLDAEGNDVPEIRLMLEAAVGAAVDLVIVTAGVEAGVRAILDLNLHDGGFADPPPPENLDGKLRVDEIVQVIQANPICMFDVSGRLEAFIRLFVKIDLGLFSKTFKQTIVNIVLLELEDITADLCDPPEPVLAEKDGSTLVLNMGERAGHRNYDEGNPEEEFTVRQLTEGDTGATISVTAYGIVQKFEGIDEVVASGADGDDKVTTEQGAVSGVCQEDGSVEPDIGLGCEGLPDDDSDDAEPGGTVTKLIPFTVPVSFCGGAGADTIGGGRGDDVLRGDGKLNDPTITGDGSTDCVPHDSGGDEDTGDGVDKINGSAGDDDIHGGRDADDLNGDAGDDEVRGGRGDDQITGGPGRDELRGEGDNDTILGGPEADPCPSDDRDRCDDVADDEIHGGSGSDSIEGDHGKDTVHAGPHADTVVGGLGDDAIHGDGGPDSLFGNEGHDEVNGGSHDDDVFGGVGDDDLSGGADEDDIVGGAGKDDIDGGEGYDVILGDQGTINRDADPTNDGDHETDGDFLLADPDLPLVDPVDADLGPADVVAADFADEISGGPQPDRIRGQEGGDTINGNGGADVARGNDGDDVISGDQAGDELFGDRGDDIIHGDDPTASHGSDDGVDVVRGGPGDDLVEGNAAGDRLFGDGGRDTIFGDAEDEAPCDADGNSTDGDDVVRGGPDDDELFGNAGDDRITGNGGRDRIVGGSDSFGVCDGVDTIVGGMAADVISGDNATIDDASATDDMLVRTWLDGEGAGDVVHGDGGDASRADDRIFGQHGDDELRGGAGHDYIEGNHGPDTIFGGDHDDDLVGGSSASDDVGGGDPVAVYDADRAGTGRDDSADIIDGGAGEDWIAGDNALVNRNVDDGRADLELFDVGLASETPPPASTHGGDELSGGGDADRIFGQGSDDTIEGDAGADYAEGNAGDDTMLGNAGHDDLIGGGSADDGVIVPDRVGDGLRDTGETLIDGGTGEDYVAGDNALISRNVPGDPAVAFILFDVHTTTEFAGIDAGEHGLTHGGETLITGGDGDDWIFGQGGDDTVEGNAGADYAEGNEDRDLVLGGPGTDDLAGGSSADDGVIDGDRTGDDLRDAEDEVAGGAGVDWIVGDNGLINRNRPADAGRAPIELFDVEVDGGPDVANTTSGGDFLRGDADEDRIFGQGNGAQDLAVELDPGDGRNNDFIASGDVNDPDPNTDPDFDRATGTADEDAATWSGDIIWGGTGDDEIEGNHGNDLIFGNAPATEADAPAPNDDEDDIVGGGSADDGRIFDDTRQNVGAGLLDGHDVIHGDEGDASVGDDDVILGDNGWIDRTGAVEAGDGPEVHTSGSAAGDPIPVSLPVRTMEMGTDPPPAGTFGDDYVSGNGGHDDLVGQAGDDALNGEWGSDGIVGDLGTIAVELLGSDGGSCGDPRTVEPNEPFITEDVCQPGTLFRRVELFRFDDTETGVVEGEDVILGGDGDDWLHGGPGLDLLNGDGDGGDEVPHPDLPDTQVIVDPNEGSADLDRIFGGDSNGAGQTDDVQLGDGDNLWGGRGHDHLFGGHGADNHDVRPDPDDPYPDTWGAWAEADVESYHGVDHIYGGHGPDAMQANVADNGPEHGDRLMDWAGTFNLSLLCPATYGAYVTVRDMSPDLIRYWEEIADTDGVLDVTSAGSSGYRELAMVYKPDVKDNNNPPYPNTPGHFHDCGD